MTVLDQRALVGRQQRARPIKPSEAEDLQVLHARMKDAQRAYYRQITYLYLVGVSQTSIATTTGTTAQNVGNMIRRWRQRAK